MSSDALPQYALVDAMVDPTDSVFPLSVYEPLARLQSARNCRMPLFNDIVKRLGSLIVTADDHLKVLDAKLSFDGNSLFRHADIKALRDESEEDPKEIEASKYDLAYIALDGEIGCMVNGAGLAMATMDIIKYAGGSPANFLDVGGGANAEQVKNAFRILLSDKSVKAVLINIFGGILRCDTLANGVVTASRDLNIQVPVVVRMEGTNVELGRQILKDSGLNFTVGMDMLDAAQKVVKLAAQ